MASQLINIINDGRRDPQKLFKQYYNRLQNAFNGNKMTCFGKTIETTEGKDILNDLAQYLNYTPAAGTLIQSPALNQAAQSIALEKGAKGEASHEKPRVIDQKVKTTAQLEGKVGELICLSTSGPEQAFQYLVLDDGLLSRKRRRMLFDQGYRYIGVGSSSHSVYGSIVVILLAEAVK